MKNFSPSRLNQCQLAGSRQAVPPSRILPPMLLSKTPKTRRFLPRSIETEHRPTRNPQSKSSSHVESTVQESFAAIAGIRMASCKVLSPMTNRVISWPYAVCHSTGLEKDVIPAVPCHCITGHPAESLLGSVGCIPNCYNCLWDTPILRAVISKDFMARSFALSSRPHFSRQQATFLPIGVPFFVPSA